MAKLTSLPPVDRISFVSYQSLIENGMQYSGNFSRSGLLLNCLSNSVARSSASGCWRNSLQTNGHVARRVPDEGCLSHSALHVTERSPRMLRVSSAFTWP